MSIARFIAGCGAFLATFAGFAVMFAGCMRLGEMLSGPDAAYAKAVVIAAVAGEAIELQACKPCPFCGAADLPDKATPIAVETPMGRWAVVCLACRAHGPECKTERAAIDAWNRRCR